MEAVNAWEHQNYVNGVKCRIFFMQMIYGCCSKFGHLVFTGDKGDSSKIIYLPAIFCFLAPTKFVGASLRMCIDDYILDSLIHQC